MPCCFFKKDKNKIKIEQYKNVLLSIDELTKTFSVDIKVEALEKQLSSAEYAKFINQCLAADIALPQTWILADVKNTVDFHLTKLTAKAPKTAKSKDGYTRLAESAPALQSM